VLSGNTVILANGYYPELLFDLVAEHLVDWLQLTPTHLRLAEQLLPERAADLDSLRAVLHSSAWCPPDTKRRWMDAIGPERVFEMYAATEDIGTTLCRGTEWLERPGTVGRGVLTRIRILDPQGRAVPVGTVGEVHLRRARSRRDPRPQDGFRSVGDHGRVDAAGYLYLSGRADDLVIIGGENVYLGEVEAVLLAQPEVADAAVIAVHDDTYGAVLHAYVTPRPGRTPDIRGLQQRCRQQLPAGKTPRSIQLVDHIPRTAAGKLRRPSGHHPAGTPSVRGRTDD
jgi:bile acid-coenzyme A ligase